MRACWEGFALSSGDDKLLLTAFVQGDREAFEQVVALYSPRVTRLTWRLLGWSGEVDDVVQDVFVTALEQCRNFRGDKDLWPWLTAITVNKCRTRMRRHFLRLRWLYARSPEAPAAAGSDEPALRDETSAKVRTAIRALPPRDREVIVLYYLEDRSVSEICSMLGATENAIDVRLHRARKRLRELLEDFAT